MLETFTQIMDSNPQSVESNEIGDPGLSLDFYGIPGTEEAGSSYLPSSQGIMIYRILILICLES